MKITMEEWLSALEALQNSNPVQGWTTKELGKVFNHDPHWIREKLIRPLLDSGSIGCSIQRSTTIDGRPCNQPIYFLKSLEVATDEKITEPRATKAKTLLHVERVAIPDRGRRRVSNDRQRKAKAKGTAR